MGYKDVRVQIQEVVVVNLKTVFQLFIPPKDTALLTEKNISGFSALVGIGLREIWHKSRGKCHCKKTKENDILAYCHLIM